MIGSVDDSAVDKQAAELAERTSITEAQARAYIVNKRADDDTAQRRLASHLDISPSAFSKHLSAAQAVLDRNGDDQSATDALAEFVLTSGAGGANSDMRRVVTGTHSENKITAIVTEYAFDNVDEVMNYKYRLHMYVHGVPDGEYMAEMPSSMHLPGRGKLLTVGAETLTKLSEYAAAMLEKEGVDHMDQAGVMFMFKQENVDISEWEASVFENA